MNEKEELLNHYREIGSKIKSDISKQEEIDIRLRAIHYWKEILELKLENEKLKNEKERLHRCYMIAIAALDLLNSDKYASTQDMKNIDMTVGEFIKETFKEIEEA